MTERRMKGRSDGGRRALAAAALVGAAMVTPGPAAADCGTLAKAVDQARAAGNLDTLRSLHEQVAVDPSCDAAYRGWMGQMLAREAAKAIQVRLRAGEPLAAVEGDLRAAAEYGDYWMIQAMLGDLSYGRKEYASAAGHYQQALAVIQDEAATPQAPPQGAIRHIFEQAEQARMLADRYVETPRTRSGAPAGLGADNIRGFVPKAVALPVEFQFNSTAFTDKGQAAATDLLRQLMSGGTPAITLVGHTDAAGSAAYNQRLSEQRAAALAAFLQDGGYTGDITIEGRGEEDPPQVPNPQQLSPDQLDQLARRVELRR